MIIKALFIILLLMCVGVQGMFIYLLGGYDPHELNKLLRMWESFGVEIVPYTAFMLSITQAKAIWLIPKLNLIIGGMAIIKKEWHIGLLVLVLSFFIALAFVWAIYSPAMMISISG